MKLTKDHLFKLVKMVDWSDDEFFIPLKFDQFDGEYEFIEGATHTGSGNWVYEDIWHNCDEWELVKDKD